MEHSAQARRLVDNLSGDYISTALTPSVLADVLAAQVHATLAVADALDRLLGHLEDRS
jgi:hypothetical protein